MEVTVFDFWAVRRMEFVEKAARGRRRAVLRTAPTASPWAAAAGCAAAPALLLLPFHLPQE